MRCVAACRGRRRRSWRVGNCRNGGMCRVRQVVVKVYGVATTMPQG